MVTLICLRCGKFFQHKGGFKKHILKPEICPPLVSKKTRLEILEYYHFNTNEKNENFHGNDVFLGLNPTTSSFIDKSTLIKNIKNNDFINISCSTPKIKKSPKNDEKIQSTIEEIIEEKEDPITITPTKSEEEIITVEENGKKKFKCPYCHGFYSRKNNLVSHMKNYCKSLKNEYIPIEKAELQMIKEEIGKLTSQTHIVNNYNNTTNNLQQINQNILLSAYGKENPLKVSDDFMSKVIKNPMKGIPDLISLTHFNPQKPENQNVRYNGKRNSIIDVFNGNFWEAKDKGEVIYDMIVSKKDMADDYFDEAINKNKIKEKIKDNYNNFSEKIDRYVNAIINELNYGTELIEQDKELYKQLYKQVELMMINAQRILTLKSKKAPSPFQTIE